MARGTLRIYLGAAPGVGKTYAMLNEGYRRAQRGADVVVGFVETHRRAQTAEQLRDLPIQPRIVVTHRAATFEELDLDGLLARRPAVALVDELAHTNPPGMRNAKRWQDVEELLAAGIDVISTVNVQHLESLNDVVLRITGITQRETVPDAFVRSADQIELVDMSPEALRRRLAHGNVYPPEKVDAALANYFRPGNLAALRELALLWVADRVEESLQDYLADHGITTTWETRERVVVAITGATGGDLLVRRAARIAGRLRGDLVGVHVAHPDGLSSTSGAGLEAQRALLVELGGSYREIVGHEIAASLAAFARAEQATQVVIGATKRSRLAEFTRGSVASQLQRALTTADVHIIASENAPEAATSRPRRIGRSAIPRRRELLAWVVCLVGVPLLTLLLVHSQQHLNLSTDLLLQLGLVVLVAAIGGIRPGVVAAITSSLLTNFYLTPPTHTFTIGDRDNVIALAVFVAVAIGVSALVDRAATQGRDAQRARADATAIARSTGSIVGNADPMPDLVDQLRALFGLEAVAVLHRDGGNWVITAAAGEHPPTAPRDGTAVPLDDSGDVQLVLRGGRITDDDLGVLRAFADQMSLGLEANRLRAEAATVESLSEANVLRTALLQAVSHDLRTPLASIKASVTGLMEGEVGFSPEDRGSLLHNIDQSADRLDRVVGNLLDMSRLQAGATNATVVPTATEEVVAAALSALAAPTHRVQVDVSAELPLVLTDGALLERAIANLVSNALAWSPADRDVWIEAATVRGHVDLRIIDRGPGIPVEARERIFQPFQRLGDRSNDAGVGLGLAIAKGFVEVIGGQLEVDDTPGGGCTFTISLPIAPEAAA
jgi:two-component system, OmpR family, sensor histidine kinase KdpD